MRPAMQDITIRLAPSGDPLHVQGVVDGYLAVHAEPDPFRIMAEVADPYWWTITHVPSGCRVMGMIPTMALALNILRGLSQLCRWHFRTVEEMDREDYYWARFVIGALREAIEAGGDV